MAISGRRRWAAVGQLICNRYSDVGRRLAVLPSCEGVSVWSRLQVAGAAGEEYPVKVLKFDPVCRSTSALSSDPRWQALQSAPSVC